jgi:hypothetical protein
MRPDELERRLRASDRLRGGPTLRAVLVGRLMRSHARITKPRSGSRSPEIRSTRSSLCSMKSMACEISARWADPTAMTPASDENVHGALCLEPHRCHNPVRDGHVLAGRIRSMPDADEVLMTFVHVDGNPDALRYPELSYAMALECLVE